MREEWLRAIENNVGNTDYHQLLVNALSAVSPEDTVLPPNFPPPALPRQSAPRSQNRSSNNTSNSRQTGQVHEYGAIRRIANNGVSANPYVPPTNSFAHLAIEDDEEEVNDSRRSNVNYGNRRSMQVRYLLVRAECGYAECIRAKATAAGKDKDWVRVPVLWQEAYNLINRTLQDTNDWWAILVSASDMVPVPENLQDGHSRSLLVELLESLRIVEDSTERERQAALRLLDKNLKKVQEKLSPLQEGRQNAMTAMGEERWNNNPRPKMDYVERMRLLAVEEEQLLAAMLVLQELQLQM